MMNELQKVRMKHTLVSYSAGLMSLLREKKNSTRVLHPRRLKEGVADRHPLLYNNQNSYS